MKQECCAVCKYFCEEFIDGKGDVGECVRFPPQITSQMSGDKHFSDHRNTRFPVVSHVRWCGEFKH